MLAAQLASTPPFRLACGHACWSLFCKSAVQQFSDQFSHAPLHVDICSTLDGLSHLLSADIGCFIGTKMRRLNDPDLFRFEPLFNVSDGVFVCRDHPLTGRRVTRLDFSLYPMLDVAPISVRHFDLIGADRYHGALNVFTGHSGKKISTNSINTGLEILAESDAFLVYPRAVTQEFSKADVVEISVSDFPKDRVQIGIYSLAKPSEPSAISIFRQLVEKQVSAMRNVSGAEF